MRIISPRIFVLTRKEIYSWLNSPAIYGVTVFFVLFVSIWLYYIQRFFAMDTASLRPFFQAFPFVYIFVIPVLTMRVWAEEKKFGSAEILFTMPFTEWELVLGKFFSCFALLLAMVLLTVPVPLSILPLGRFEGALIFGEYAGTLFLGASATALGVFLSGVSKNQAAAFVGSVVALLAVMLMHQLTENLPSGLASLINYLSLAFHFESFSRGLLDSRDMAFFLITTIIFLFLNTQVLVYRRWK
jgi:ABC-2 type transport system permease protein